MQRSTKHALKQKLRQWEAVQNHFATKDEYQQGKISHLEDLLYLYQQEIEHQISNTNVTDIQDFRRIEDQNAALARQVKVLNEELATMRKAKEAALQQSTSDFQKLLARNSERFQGNERVLMQENSILKAKVTNLEAQMRELDAVAQAKTASEVVDLGYRIQDLETIVKEKETEIRGEQEMRQELEEELSRLQARFQGMVEFVESLDSVTRQVSAHLGIQKKHHIQLVNTLLQSNFDQESGEVNVDLQPEAEEDEGEDGNGDAATAGGNNKSLVGGAGVDSLFDGGTPSERLSSAITKLEGAMDSHQAELAVAVRSAMETFNDKTRELSKKLHTSYAHCELQMQRIRDLEVRFSEERDTAYAERDQAMVHRDQALQLLRSRERRDHRFQKSVEVQTTVRGDFGTAMKRVEASGGTVA